jgi:hypothetical protein
MQNTLGLYWTRVSALSLVAGALCLIAAPHALAQGSDTDGDPNAAKKAADDEEEEEEEEPEAKPEAPKAEAEAEAKTAVAPTAAASDTAPTSGASGDLADDHLEKPNGFVMPQRVSTLEWHGGFDVDPTWAQYSFKDEVAPTQHFNEMRGRFVAGPTVEHRFGENDRWFVRARGEFVVWVRETTDYQINADDVYGQVGKTGLWDLKVGRFRPWRVYHKGAGFDLYTIEDQGACTIRAALDNACSLDSGTFGPHTYEVSYIYDREAAGRVGVHVYPTPWSGIEVVGTLGNSGNTNVVGGRAAALVHFDFLRVSAAAEYRELKPGRISETCPNCNVSRYYGFGGGAEVTVKPVAVGLNVAQGHDTKYNPVSGVLDTQGSPTRTSLGGYAEFDVGSLAIERSLIVGFGLNRTELLDDLENFQQHYQGAAYAVFPLGFDAASLKLVASQATYDVETVDPVTFVVSALPTAKMTALRLRFSYPF